MYRTEVLKLVKIAASTRSQVWSPGGILQYDDDTYEMQEISSLAVSPQVYHNDDQLVNCHLGRGNQREAYVDCPKRQFPRFP
jgi:hypothetical protein